MDAVKVILDENINIGADRAKLLKVSGTQITYNTPSNNGSILGGQILFSNLALPSLSNSVISRNMRIRYQVRVEGLGIRLFNPTIRNYQDTLSGGTNLPLGALRPFPLACCTDTCILTLNNIPIATSNRQMMSGLMRTLPKDYLEKQATEGPSQLDNGSMLMADGTLAVPTAGDVSIVLTSSQPLSTNLNCPYSTSRASFAPVSYVYGVPVSGGGFTNDVAIFEVCEPVFSPILSLYEDNRYIANCNTLSVQYTYSNLGDMVVYAGSAAYPAGYSVSLVDNSARLEYSVISLDSRVVAIPRVVSYDYNLPQYFPTPLPAFTSPVSAGSVQNTGFVPSQSLRLSYMPSLIYIYAQVPVSTRAQNAVAGSASYADFYYALGNASGGVGTIAGITYNTDQTNVISISLNNRQGLGAGLSIRSLYRISVSNGYASSFNDWLASPIIIISPTKDLGLDLSQSDIYPAMSGNVTLTIQAMFNNTNVLQRSAQILGYGNAGSQYGYPWFTQTSATLMVLCVQEGIAEISPDTLVINGGPLSATEVKLAIEEGARGESVETAFVPSAVEKQGAGSLKDMFGKTRNVVTSVAKGIGSVIDDPLFRSVLKSAGGRMRR